MHLTIKNEACQSRWKYCENSCSSIHFQLWHINSNVRQDLCFAFCWWGYWRKGIVCLCEKKLMALLVFVTLPCFVICTVMCLLCQWKGLLFKNEPSSWLVWLGKLHWLLQFLSRRLFGRVSVKGLRNFQTQFYESSKWWTLTKTIVFVFFMDKHREAVEFCAVCSTYGVCVNTAVGRRHRVAGNCPLIPNFSWFVAKCWQQA